MQSGKKYCNVISILIQGVSLDNELGPSSAKKCRGLTLGTCFFCIVQLENNPHCFIQCLIPHNNKIGSFWHSVIDVINMLIVVSGSSLLDQVGIL